MESLLAVAFDNLSSRSLAKVRKGCRQIDGLLVQICLARPLLSTAGRSTVSNITKPLSELCNDVAYREFFRLQNDFEWNASTRLISCLERLMGSHSSSEVDQMIACTMNLMQGLLLLHPPSRLLFSRESSILLALDLLDPSNDAAILRSTLLVLTTALLDSCQNTRVFENAEGLHTTAQLLSSATVDLETKKCASEFLCLYLVSEKPATSRDKEDVNSSSCGSLPKHLDSTVRTRSTDDKRRLLGQFVDLDELLSDFKHKSPFDCAILAE